MNEISSWGILINLGIKRSQEGKNYFILSGNPASERSLPAALLPELETRRLRNMSASFRLFFLFVS